MRLRPPLILTGAPAVGKSATGAALARQRSRCAFIDVDDLRQLLLTGGVAPWKGQEGQRQQRVSVLNATALTATFIAHEIEVVIADVLTPRSARLYRERLPTCLIVHLRATWPETLRRAANRPRWITDNELRLLHRADAALPPDADHHADVDNYSLEDQVFLVAELWSATAD